MSLDPLDPELAALFEDAPIPSAPAEAKARAFARLAALSATPPKATSSKVGAATELGRRAIALATTTFVAGAIVGGLVVSARQPTRVVYVDRPASMIEVPPSPATPSMVGDSTAPSAPATPAISPSSIPSTTHAVPSVVPSSRTDYLAAERALLDHARRALASDGGVEALGLLDRHAKRFPRGKLAEEREALAIEALVHAGRLDEARARAADFRRKSPQSLYLEAIDVTLRSIP